MGEPLDVRFGHTAAFACVITLHSSVLVGEVDPESVRASALATTAAGGHLVRTPKKQTTR